MAKALNNGMDIIDSRDVIKRIAELNDNESLEDDEKEELLALEELQDACVGGDWKDGVTLIRDSYFERYAQELAEETGSMREADVWPYCHIDWKAAATSLQQDYSSADFDGETYWFRDF